MEENKKKKIEARLREMLLSVNQPRNENRSPSVKSIGAMVIRRRKGVQDLRIK